MCEGCDGLWDGLSTGRRRRQMITEWFISLCAVLALVGGLVFGAGAVVGREENPLSLLYLDRPLTLREALKVALYLDGLADGLEAPDLPRDTQGLQLLAYEIAPYFRYERLASRTNLAPARWEYYAGDGNFHVLGRCYITLLGPLVTVNVRHANPMASKWYARSYFSTLVHEMGHAQGILPIIGRDIETMEATNQLATVEVLAAMATDGNAWALPAFIREVQGYLEDYALWLALEADEVDQFRAYVVEAANTPAGPLGFDRMMRRWANDMDQLRYILRAYGKRPFQMMLDGLRADDLSVHNLAYLPVKGHTAQIDDTHSLLQHLLDLVEAYPAMLERYATKD